MCLHNYCIFTLIYNLKTRFQVFLLNSRLIFACKEKTGFLFERLKLKIFEFFLFI